MIFLLCLIQCCGFDTPSGGVTAAHCNWEQSETSWPEFDIAIGPRQGTEPIPIGKGQPFFFRCRRRTRYFLEAKDLDKYQWVVNREFFPGESGLPVFNKKGEAVGVVLGNVLIENRWRGRVGKLNEIKLSERTAIQPFASAIVVEQKILPDPNRRRVLLTPPADRSTSEPATDAQVLPVVRH